MRTLPLLLFVAALLVFLLLALIGGAEHALDVAVIRTFQDWRTAQPQATTAVIWLTHAGGAPFLLTVAGCGAAFLLWRRQKVRAWALVLTVLGGRLGLEAVKLLVDRPRPSFDAHPVTVFSQSFPSGHAGNSMVTYVALALFVAPERWRVPAVVAGFGLALAIGATRPMLGVHWPSDVVGGWLYGLAVVALGWTLSRRERNAA